MWSFVSFFFTSLSSFHALQSIVARLRRGLAGRRVKGREEVTCIVDRKAPGSRRVVGDHQSGWNRSVRVPKCGSMVLVTAVDFSGTFRAVCRPWWTLGDGKNGRSLARLAEAALSETQGTHSLAPLRNADWLIEVEVGFCQGLRFRRQGCFCTVSFWPPTMSKSLLQSLFGRCCTWITSHSDIGKSLFLEADHIADHLSSN